jgi:hypothetical protein
MHNESAFAKLCYFGAKSRFNVVSPRKENPMPTEYFIIDLFSRAYSGDNDHQFRAMPITQTG